MIQGTCSNAGKSLLTAAFCRIFFQDGHRPVPFKSQNMALNSFVTQDNCEMGRAQALQALACGLAPDVRMNPVLLKPHSDIGSQVIVMGRPVAHMRVREYIAYKPTAWDEITAAYDSLAAEADMLVIEGAGSPAEINLKAHDIVNMAVARYAKAPVLLCADIDRGGAFAAIVGTMALLDDEERKRVAGFILNKFRGDSSLLDSALREVSSRTGVPFVGVVPYVHGLHLPDEDSVSFRLSSACSRQVQASVDVPLLDIAIIDLPHTSNITDLDALAVEDDVQVRVVRRAQDLGVPDILILPGTKNTMADMDFLRRSGFSSAILACAQSIPCILGICGGLQMLGTRICDSLGVEGVPGQALAALGLLPLETDMRAHKTLRLCKGFYKDDTPVHGYEIHHGTTGLVATGGTTSAVPVIRDSEGRVLGWESIVTGSQSMRQRILGTYMHGILDSDAFRRVFLDDVREAKGWHRVGRQSSYDLNPHLDALAAAVREAVDMSFIYELLHKKYL